MSKWLIDRTLSGATTLGENGLWSDSNEGVLRISQSFSITGASASACLVFYSVNSLGGCGSYPSAEMLSVYSTSPAHWATSHLDQVGWKPLVSWTWKSSAIIIFYLLLQRRYNMVIWFRKVAKRWSLESLILTGCPKILTKTKLISLSMRLR